MCVAVIIESENRVSKAHLQAMHEANPHGGGIAWMSDGVVHFRKGLKWEEIDALQDRLPRPFLMHFRIATRGDKIPELTHPFPIGEQAFSQDLVGISDKGVIIHNGTWSDYRKYIPGGVDPNSNKISDTQIAAYVAAWHEDILEDVNWSNAIMKPNGVWYRGNWERFEGNLFSNLHWKRELFDWTEYQNWQKNRARTTTPFDVRKKGKSHQENRNQENGRTVGQYPTQFNKTSGPYAGAGKNTRGSGLHTVQSNGKTVSENREAKRNKRKKEVAKTQPMGVPTSAYEQATRAYNDNQTTSSTAWDGERLFTDKELPGYAWNEEGKLIKNVGGKPSGDQRQLNLEKYLGPSVKCPDCNEEIVQIPCQCGMDSETALETALVTISKAEAESEKRLDEMSDDELDALINKYSTEEHEPIGFQDTPTFEGSTSDGIPDEIELDCNDVEDMNVYGMSAGLDGLPQCEDEGAYLDPDWKEIDRTIRAQGIKIN